MQNGQMYSLLGTLLKGGLQQYVCYDVKSQLEQIFKNFTFIVNKK